MPRVRNIVASRRRRKKLLKKAKGFQGARGKLLRVARDSVWRAGAYSFAHRRKRPGEFRKLWIIRINAACRENGLTYSKFMHGLILQNIQIDRKILADMAVKDPGAFKTLTEKVSAAIH